MELGTAEGYTISRMKEEKQTAAARLCFYGGIFLLKVKKERRLLMWTIMLIAMVQMPHIALMPAIDLIQTRVFTDKSIATIQTVMSLPNLISIAFGVGASLLVRSGLLSKKTSVICGTGLVALTGVSAIFLHAHFWQLCMLSVMLGAGLGLFISNTQSIMMDSFPEDELQALSGVQFAFLNTGGILMSVVGGLLTTPKMWYGGYTVLLIVAPVTVLALFTLPKGRVAAPNKAAGKQGKAAKLPRDVYYYSMIVFIFMLVYNVASSNLSTHLAANQIGTAATAGVVSAVMMAGGVLAGLSFQRFSPKLGDYAISLSFAILAVTFTVMNLFPASITAVYVAMFFAGMTVSVVVPQSIFRVSSIVDATNSATATMLLSCIAAGLGGFLSPVLFTNLTSLFSAGTGFRFQFVAIVSLILGGVHASLTRRRLAVREQAERQEA